MPLRIASLLVVLLAALPHAPAAQTPAPPLSSPLQQTPPGTLQAPSPRTTYILGPDDVLAVQVLDVPELNGKSARIDPNGDLRMPMIGRVHAAGMTVEELEGEIGRRLKAYLNEPDVAVMVSEFHSQAVSVIGAVRNPGLHQLQGKRTLVELLSMAGGVASEAGPIVRIMRRSEWGAIPLETATRDADTGASLVDIDLAALLNAERPTSNIAVLPNDVVSVPRADVAYVVGEVGRAGPVLISRAGSVSVMEAVSVSGGVLRTGAPKRARILRANNALQTRTEIPVNLQRIMQGKDRDVALQSGDILVVPDNSGKRITTRAAEVAVQMGIVIGTYGIVR